jgi:crotonobetainyl-CoA:carnitine CoA-transferase CaiB-like acyl-CoA transferase
MHDPHCLENDVFDDRGHPDFGQVRLHGVGPRFSGMTGIIRRPPPLLGQHTEEVLTELGYTGEQVAELLNNKVIFQAKEEG